MNTKARAGSRTHPSIQPTNPTPPTDLLQKRPPAFTRTLYCCTAVAATPGPGFAECRNLHVASRPAVLTPKNKHTCGRSHSRRTPGTGPIFCWRRQPWTHLVPICTCGCVPSSVLDTLPAGQGARSGTRQHGRGQHSNTAQWQQEPARNVDQHWPASRHRGGLSCGRLLCCVMLRVRPCAP